MIRLLVIVALVAVGGMFLAAFWPFVLAFVIVAYVLG